MRAATTSLAQLRALAAGLPGHRTGVATVRVLAADLAGPTSLDTCAVLRK